MNIERNANYKQREIPPPRALSGHVRQVSILRGKDRPSARGRADVIKRSGEMAPPFPGKSNVHTPCHTEVHRSAKPETIRRASCEWPECVVCVDGGVIHGPEHRCRDIRMSL